MPRGGSAVTVTVDELIATLNHSSMPTLVVEGEDDLIVFRRLEERATNLRLSVLPVKGRQRVLALYTRRQEIRNEKVMFAADRDLWCMTDVPQDYVSERLLLTKGYSIENDAYEDADAETLLTRDECNTFTQELDVFVRWYALALARHSENSETEIKRHPSEILDDQAHRETLMKLGDDEAYPQALFDHIRGQYTEKLRGKSLIALFVRRMVPGRPVKHSGRAILEIAAARPGPNISSLFSVAEAYLV